MLIRDQIHGDIYLSEAEERLVNSFSFQRMRRIKQLGFVEYTYPCATHSRFQHSLGVCQCVTDMYNAVCRNNKDFYRQGDLELLRMMALVHDMGHSPFSHASEVLSDITHEERLADILEYEKKNIILAHDYDCEAWDLINQVYNGTGSVYLSDKHLIALHGFMDWFIDADKLDYLERDAINCGVSYGNFDRQALVNNLTVIKDKNGFETIGIKTTGIQALESFILARYYMFSQVYMSPMERIYRKQFVYEMQNLLTSGKYPDDVKKFLKLDDSTYVKKFKFLEGEHIDLLYDSNYNEELASLISKRLGKYVVVDCPRKAVYRKDAEDANILCVDDLTGEVRTVSEVSALIKSFEFLNIHKLRVYADKAVSRELKVELQKIIEEVKQDEVV